MVNIEHPHDYTMKSNYGEMKTDSIWYMNGETDQFGIYDERDIYEFNYIGSHQGNSSIEAMKDFYLFGQDEEERGHQGPGFDDRLHHALRPDAAHTGRSGGGPAVCKERAANSGCCGQCGLGDERP